MHGRTVEPALKLVLRIGGSILGSPPKGTILEGYSEVILRLAGGGHSLGVVVGGGEIARSYIASAKAAGLPNRDQDLVAIQASRLNAVLVGLRLGIRTPVPTTIGRMVSRLARGGLAVMGGLKPGITTDTVAALLAEAWGADLIIKASDQEGVYTADPRIDGSATLLRSISYPRLNEILGGEYRPGMHSIVDPVAVQHLTRTKQPLVVLDGSNPRNVEDAVVGRRVGTRVSERVKRHP